jgi:hypothetical protein
MDLYYNQIIFYLKMNNIIFYQIKLCVLIAKKLMKNIFVLIVLKKKNKKFYLNIFNGYF